MIVIDDFIKDKNLLEAITGDDTFFDHNGDYMWWDGWWNSPSDTKKKKLIEYIWANNSQLYIDNLMGFIWKYILEVETIHQKELKLNLIV
jgi:hypothetical protein